MQQVVFVITAALGTVAIIAAVGLSVMLIGAEGRRRWLRRADRPSGRLVDVNGTPIHVIERGPRRGPTVVLVAGVGGVGAHWAGIIDRLSPSVHTIAYDRAGLGWSGAARAPRTLDAMADELDGLLEAVETPGPLVIVGHSLGGIIARRFAFRHPQRVGGLVLVDSAHEEQYSRLPEVQRIFERMTAMPRLAVRVMAAISVLRQAPRDPRLPPADAATLRTAMVVNSAHLSTGMAEMRAVASDIAPVASLGDLPLVVLRHGRSERMPMLPPELNDRFEALFADLQGELADLSTRGRVVVVEGGGHDIHLDRPEVVVEAIDEVIRTSTTGPRDRARAVAHSPVAQAGLQATAPGVDRIARDSLATPVA
jgi:pimeloyl-ACP methyl ester carboxylesterase